MHSVQSFAFRGQLISTLYRFKSLNLFKKKQVYAKKSYLPGHGRVLHDWTSSLSPTQSRPSNFGGGLVHVLERVCVPPPQDKVQELNLLHSDQLASTKILKERRSKETGIGNQLYICFKIFFWQNVSQDNGSRKTRRKCMGFLFDKSFLNTS